MWIADGWRDYQVIDCSQGEKLERWGRFVLLRPDPQVIWDTPKTDRMSILGVFLVFRCNISKKNVPSRAKISQKQ